MQNLLSEAAHVLCIIVVTSLALSMILPNLRRVLAKNKEARSKAKLHLRYYTDDLQTLVEREMLNEVVAIKEAAYAAVAAGQANRAFSVLRYPTKERKPHLFSTLLDLSSAA